MKSPFEILREIEDQFKEEREQISRIIVAADMLAKAVLSDKEVYERLQDYYRVRATGEVEKAQV